MKTTGPIAGGRTILAIVENPADVRRCLTFALRAAGGGTGRVIKVLHIEVDPQKVWAAPEEISIQQSREPLEGSAHSRAVQVRRAVDLWLVSHPDAPVISEWVTGTVEAVVAERAETAHLIVLSQPHNLDGADALHASIFRTGKPVLYVPHHGADSGALDHLAIAWNNTAHTLAALEELLPWLSDATRVSVITVDEPDRTRDTTELEALLNAHELSYNIHHAAHPKNGGIGSAILEQALRLEADALVMGAYRFGQLLELTFGGVTVELLSDSSLPIFLAH